LGRVPRRDLEVENKPAFDERRRASPATSRGLDRKHSPTLEKDPRELDEDLRELDEDRKELYEHRIDLYEDRLAEPAGLAWGLGTRLRGRGVGPMLHLVRNNPEMAVEPGDHGVVGAGPRACP